MSLAQSPAREGLSPDHWIWSDVALCGHNLETSKGGDFTTSGDLSQSYASLPGDFFP